MSCFVVRFDMIEGFGLSGRNHGNCKKEAMTILENPLIEMLKKLSSRSAVIFFSQASFLFQLRIEFALNF